jgi:hypothetical protein
LAHERFTNISSDKERKAFETFFKNTQRGERVDLTPELDAHNDVCPLINPAFAIVSERDRIIEADILTNPVYADIWEKDRVILADWINWLCTDPKASAKVTSNGIDLAGAKIEGGVNLAWTKLQFPLRTYKCAFNKDISLDRASLRSIQLQATFIKSLHGDGLTVERDILLKNGFWAEGEVRLEDASIGGSLDCDGGQFINPGATALDLRSAKIGSIVSLGYDFKALGGVSLYGATISGRLRCDYGSFINPEPVQPAPVHQEKVNRTLAALTLESATTGPVFLRDGFTAEGAVRLFSAKITGILQCDGGQFINPRGIALDLENAKTGSVLLRDGFTARGEVLLRDTVVDGRVECDRGEFINTHATVLTPQAIALNLYAAKTGAIYLRKEFRAVGEVFLRGATISGVLDCHSGHFINPHRNALDAWHTTVRGDVDLTQCEADGNLRFAESQIDGSLILLNVTLSGETDLDLRYAKVKTLLNAKDSSRCLWR